MGKNKNIVFISPYRYLAFPLFSQVTPSLNNFHTIYLELKDPASFEVDSKFIKPHGNQIKHFKEYREISESLYKEKYPNFVSSLYNKRKRLILYKKSIIEELNFLNPLCIISTSDLSLSDRISAEWCEKNKLPFIILQSAFIDPLLDLSTNFIYKIKRLIVNSLLRIPYYRKQQVYGNEISWGYLFLWSETFVTNRTRKRTFFLGNPLFDQLFNKFSSNRTRKNRVIICTQKIEDVWGEEKVNKINNIYMDVIRAKPDTHFYLKIHPREDIEKYKKILAEFDLQNTTLTKDDNLFDLFDKSDIQISVISYTGVQAAALGLPIIFLQPEWLDSVTDPKLGGDISIFATDSKKLIDAINLALSEAYLLKFFEKRKIFFEKFFTFLDNQSGQRVAEKIVEIIENLGV
jgi:hypothetical protein